MPRRDETRGSWFVAAKSDPRQIIPLDKDARSPKRLGQTSRFLERCRQAGERDPRNPRDNLPNCRGRCRQAATAHCDRRFWHRTASVRARIVRLRPRPECNTAVSSLDIRSVSGAPPIRCRRGTADPAWSRHYTLKSRLPCQPARCRRASAPAAAVCAAVEQTLRGRINSTAVFPRSALYPQIELNRPYR